MEHVVLAVYNPPYYTAPHCCVYNSYTPVLYVCVQSFKVTGSDIAPYTGGDSGDSNSSENITGPIGLALIFM